ncbi:hypothetical protein [Chryseobacterium sp. M5A1_1a]
MKKSIKNLEAKSLGGFKKTFGSKVFGGGCPTWSIPEIVITVPKKPKALAMEGDLEQDGSNDGPC